MRAKEGTASHIMSALNYEADILRRFFWWFQRSSGVKTHADGNYIMELANPSRLQLAVRD